MLIHGLYANYLISDLISTLPFNSTTLLLLDSFDLSDVIIYSFSLSLNKFIVVSFRLNIFF